MEQLNKPIKRHQALKPISRDHHFGLLLCWKIRQGFLKNIELDRIKKYTDWFYNVHLKEHFDLEEKYIFSILSPNDKLVKRALAEHRRLARLFEDETNILKSLNLIEEELDLHIRFEERVVFKAVQEIASEEQLQLIEGVHQHKELDDWDDEFWNA